MSTKGYKIQETTLEHTITLNLIDSYFNAGANSKRLKTEFSMCFDAFKGLFTAVKHIIKTAFYFQ